MRGQQPRAKPTWSMANVICCTSAHLDRLIIEPIRTHNLKAVGSIPLPQPGVACSPSWSLLTGFLLPDSKFNDGEIADQLNRQSSILGHRPHPLYKGLQGLSRLGAQSSGRFSFLQMRTRSSGSYGRSRPIRHVERSGPAGRLQGRERQLIGFGIATILVVTYPFSTVLGLYSLNYRRHRRWVPFSLCRCRPAHPPATAH